MTLLLLVAAGGGVAALGQFLFAYAVDSRRRLLALNLLACAALGFAAAVDPPEKIRWLVGVGFLASLAPFAGIMLATLQYARERRYRSAAGFFILNIVGGIAAVMFGYLGWKSGITLYNKII